MGEPILLADLFLVALNDLSRVSDIVNAVEVHVRLMMQVCHRSHVSQETTGTYRSTSTHFSRAFLFNQAYVFIQHERSP